MTDAKGTSSTFGYNARGLVTSLSFAESAGVASTPDLSFGYDGAGNRTSMNDGLGSVSYVYDTMSRMTSETRTFTGLGSYTLSYEYNLSGELTKITNPWSAQVGYNYDKVGRLNNVSGLNYYGVTSYVNNISYRAFAAKQVAYANGRTLSLEYDDRMRTKRWDMPGVMGWEYNYAILAENSFRVSYAKNLNDPTLDRSYDYDHLGRLNVSHSGAEARAHVGLGSWGTQFLWIEPQKPVVKSKRVTDASGNVVSAIELDPWGGETYKSSNEAFQPKKFTTYERDVNGSDEAMHRHCHQPPTTTNQQPTTLERKPRLQFHSSVSCRQVSTSTKTTCR